MLKVGTASLVLEMIEAGVPFRDFSLDNPIRAIREVSHDLTGRRPVRLAGGRQASALDIQREYYASAVEHLQTREPNSQIEQVVDLWGRQLDAVESQDFAKVDTEIDWVIKRKLFQRYQDRYDMELSDPKISQLDLAYHDIKRGRGVFDLLQRKGLAARVTTDEDIEAAVNTPPQTTRAKLRGEFISAAQEAGRDFTVDWVHLKLNDQAQRTVLCKDPFRSVDETGQAPDREHVVASPQPDSRITNVGVSRSDSGCPPPIISMSSSMPRRPISCMGECTVVIGVGNSATSGVSL